VQGNRVAELPRFLNFKLRFPKILYWFGAVFLGFGQEEERSRTQIRPRTQAVCGNFPESFRFLFFFSSWIGNFKCAVKELPCIWYKIFRLKVSCLVTFISVKSCESMTLPNKFCSRIFTVVSLLGTNLSFHRSPHLPFSSRSSSTWELGEDWKEDENWKVCLKLTLASSLLLL
jgi:hypothetical protein